MCRSLLFCLPKQFIFEHGQTTCKLRNDGLWAMASSCPFGANEKREKQKPRKIIAENMRARVRATICFAFFSQFRIFFFLLIERFDSIQRQSRISHRQYKIALIDGVCILILNYAQFPSIAAQLIIFEKKCVQTSSCVHTMPQAPTKLCCTYELVRDLFNFTTGNKYTNSSCTTVMCVRACVRAIID